MANLALWLALNAPPPPKARPLTTPQRLGRRFGDRQTARGDKNTAQALELMRDIWDMSRGYFPGREMPVPKFSARTGAEGAVGWYPGRDGPTPVGIRLDKGFIADLLGYDKGQKLGKRARQDAFSSAVRTLLHEWAHNFQKPQNYQDRKMIEGGAEAFANTIAPQVVRGLGRRYRRAPVDYRNATRLAVKRGMPWIVRDQFAQP